MHLARAVRISGEGSQDGTHWAKSAQKGRAVRSTCSGSSPRPPARRTAVARPGVSSRRSRASHRPSAGSTPCSSGRTGSPGKSLPDAVRVVFECFRYFSWVGKAMIFCDRCLLDSSPKLDLNFDEFRLFLDFGTNRQISTSCAQFTALLGNHPLMEKRTNTMGQSVRGQYYLRR